MRFITNLLNQPYPYYIPFSRSFKLLLVFSLVIPVFLLVFQPFGLGNWTCPQKTLLIAGLFIPIFFTLTANFYGVSRLLPSTFSEEKWTIWREVVWGLWNISTIILTTSIYWNYVPFCPTGSIDWSTQIINSVLLGILPGSICLYFNYSNALKRKLKKAETINKELSSKIAFYEKDDLTLTSESSSDQISLTTDSFLFIQAYDNYCKVVYQRGNDTSSSLLRSSLKRIEGQIIFPFITRCHRSYIVNLAKVIKVKGNAREYRLILQNTDITIPVSRESYRTILGLLQDYPPTKSSSNANVA